MKQYGKLLILSLCLLLCLCACGQSQPEQAAESVSAASSAVVEPEPESFLIQYPGFVDQYFDWEHHVLALENSKHNQVDFLFELTDGKGKLLFQSDAVKPGEESGWDVSERWTQGSHKVTITSTPVYEDGTQGNPVQQTIEITVEMGEE